MAERKKLYSVLRYNEMGRATTVFVVEFDREIRPVFNLLGLCGAADIGRHLRASSLKEVYEDAVKKDPARVKLFADFAQSRGEDFYKALRDPACEVKTPDEPGFKFKDMPECNHYLREKWLKAISVNKDGILEINDKVLHQESHVTLPAQRYEMLDLAQEFCDSLREKGFKLGGLSRGIFRSDDSGYLVPNEEIILWGHGGLH